MLAAARIRSGHRLTGFFCWKILLRRFDSSKDNQVNLYGLPPVASLEIKLRLATVFFALHLNILLHDRLSDPHGGYEIADRPNGILIEVSVHEKRKFLFHLTGGIGLDDSDDLCDGQLWGDGEEYVDVILIGIHLDNLDLGMMTLDPFDEISKIAAHTALQEFATEFGREHEVISGVIYRM